MLSRLCAALGIAFDDAMLSWKPGIHESDGIWASHWYHQVEKSTGFAPPPAKEEPLPALPAELRKIADEARPYYERLAEHRIMP